MAEPLMTAATVFLILFGLAAAADGLYLHLWKYRLYARPESLREHQLHAAQGALFAPVVFLLFYADSGHAWASSVGLQMVVGNLLAVGLHVWLMLPRYRRAPAAIPAAACCAA